MLQQGSGAGGGGPHAGGGVPVLGEGACAGGGDPVSRVDAGEEVRGADLWRGLGGREGGGGWARALDVQPTPTAPAFLPDLA